MKSSDLVLLSALALGGYILVSKSLKTAEEVTEDIAGAAETITTAPQNFFGGVGEYLSGAVNTGLGIPGDIVNWLTGGTSGEKKIQFIAPPPPQVGTQEWAEYWVSQGVQVPGTGELQAGSAPVWTVQDGIAYDVANQLAFTIPQDTTTTSQNVFQQIYGAVGNTAESLYQQYFGGPWLPQGEWISGVTLW